MKKKFTKSTVSKIDTYKGYAIYAHSSVSWSVEKEEFFCRKEDAYAYIDRISAQ